jgi:hypothetical protein
MTDMLGHGLLSTNCRFNFGNVDLFLLHHRRDRLGRHILVGLQRQFCQPPRENLTRHTVAILEPAAVAFLAAICG